MLQFEILNFCFRWFFYVYERQSKSLALPDWVYFRFIIQTQKGAIMIHDCIYQFLRIFYHSRFKPQQLEMTATQLLAPVLDIILTLPLVTRIFQEFSQFSNATKMKVQSKPEINEYLMISYIDSDVSPRISDLSFCFIHISIFPQWPV